MNKLLLFGVFSFLCLTVQGQLNITYTDFDGEPLVIEKGMMQAFDVDGNGSTDFNLRSSDTGIDFLPISFVGCFASDGSYSNNGTKRILQFEKGELISIGANNLFEYIDEDAASPYTIADGFAHFWSDLEEVYIGFAVFNILGETSNGWMKVAIDESNQSLIVKEMAHTEFVIMDTGGIHAGYKGNTSNVSNLDGELNNINISPNPAKGAVQIAFEFESEESLNVTVVNGIGQTIYASDELKKSSSRLQIETANWAPGTYFVQFRTSNGVTTKSFSVL